MALEQIYRKFSYLQNSRRAKPPVHTQKAHLKSNGSVAVGGMSMLVWQAVVAQKHWNGTEFDSEDIKKLCVEAAEEMKNRG